MADEADFIGDEVEGLANGLWGTGAVEAQALGAVGPVVGQAKEKGFTGDDEDLAGFEALVEFAGGDGEVGEAEPAEESALAAVQGPAGVGAEGFVHPLAGLAGARFVEGADDLAGELEEFVGIEEGFDELLSGVGIG